MRRERIRLNSQDEKMILKLTKITKDDIKRDTQKAASETSLQIMYLHNNGKDNFQWDKKDFAKVLEEDIEE